MQQFKTLQHPPKDIETQFPLNSDHWISLIATGQINLRGRSRSHRKGGTIYCIFILTPNAKDME